MRARGPRRTARRCRAARYAYSATANSTLSLAFDGTAIDLVGTKSLYGGIATVSIDGGAATDADFYGPATAHKQRIWSATGLSPGTSHADAHGHEPQEPLLARRQLLRRRVRRGGSAGAVGRLEILVPTVAPFFTTRGRKLMKGQSVRMPLLYSVLTVVFAVVVGLTLVQPNTGRYTAWNIAAHTMANVYWLGLVWAAVGIAWLLQRMEGVCLDAISPSRASPLPSQAPRCASLACPACDK